MTSNGAPRHYRSQARPQLRLRVAWAVHGQEPATEHEGYTRDVGLGGTFVLTDAPPPVGTRVVVRLPTPSTWDPLRVPGQVRWTGDSEGEGFGMGVQFVDLAPRDVLALQELVAALEYDEGD